MASIILPTYNEAENIQLIIPKIFKVLNAKDIEAEVIVVDDNSPDGTAHAALTLADRYPVRVHVRKNERGLATAVMKGFELAKTDICVVMDADLSHPVEKLPDMIEPVLENKIDATVGSRYIYGGGTQDWTLVRRLLSKGAALLARGVTHLSDPTSGFMVIKKDLLNKVKLDPIGWKIVLEVIVKTSPSLKEVPINFVDREKGKSKLGLEVQIDYLRHLWRLYCYKYPTIYQFIQFCLVGLSGLLVDTAVLVFLVEVFFWNPLFAASLAFCTAVTWNYILNRVWTFDVDRSAKNSFSYFSFLIVCLIGLGIRIGVMHLLIEYAGMGKSSMYIIASLVGISMASIFNFIGSRYVVFSKRFGRTK